MNKQTTRRAGLAVVPAVLAAMTLSACQDEAPTAAPPTAASQPPSPSQTQEPAPTSQAPAPAPSTTEQPAPAPTSAPASSAAPAPSGSGSGGAVCEDSGSYTIDRGSVGAKPLNTVQKGKGVGGTIDISFGPPTLDTSSGNSFFPGEGKQTVIYPVTLKLSDGDFFTASYLKFGLTDQSGNPCKADVLNAVISGSDKLDVESLSPGDTLTKKLAFAVPVGADLSKYSLVFNDDSNGDAELAWTAK
ncbi:hypothetical protein [Barrientosiimonas endolithica]|uniref:DUF4352 domain-containing protein n=1 Tax=Barrientosiimonas endolithica TaxID=1535208 RepID=A0ABM8H9G8_9MICO|nr:hypothetical protein [Barrientosiimonas endolithica]BDZ57573.1 hypothetical protein GCM10025872_12300 [Barrientosiimonas endolithica]